MDIHKQERGLLQREPQLNQRERECQSTSSSDTSQSTVSVKVIAESLPEFSGELDKFRDWKQTIELLRTTHHLDDNAVKIMISLRLRGKAQKWLQSMPNHLEMTATDQLEALGGFFDHQPSKLTLRRECENRMWRKGESFDDYYFKKSILAKTITTDPKELVDLIIDGIPDVRLRDQARMQGYKKPEDVLKAFREISVLETMKNDRDNRDFKKPSTSKAAFKEGMSSRIKGVRCFNCDETGHLRMNCSNPRRERGSCYRCGSSDHHVKNCNQGTSSEMARPVPSRHLNRGPSADISGIVHPTFFHHWFHGLIVGVGAVMLIIHCCELYRKWILFIENRK